MLVCIEIGMRLVIGRLFVVLMSEAGGCTMVFNHWGVHNLIARGDVQTVGCRKVWLASRRGRLEGSTPVLTMDLSNGTSTPPNFGPE
jgi:hypothetical protein